MKTLYLNLGMGVAGDMLTAALYELLNKEEKVKALKALHDINIPGVTFIPERSEKCGIVGTHMKVSVNGVEEDESMYMAPSLNPSSAENHGSIEKLSSADNDIASDMANDAENVDSISGVGNTGNAVKSMGHAIENKDSKTGLNLSPDVRKNFREIYKIIGRAESKAHGVPVKQVHFHEVAEADAIADISAVCFLMDMIKPDKVVASPINVGGGKVRCAHGIMPVPTPATANILMGIPIYGSDIRSELCTPTGAALIRYFADEFGPMPKMTVSAIGYGMGKKDFEAANCVVAMLGESYE